MKKIIVLFAIVSLFGFSACGIKESLPGIDKSIQAGECVLSISFPKAVPASALLYGLNYNEK
jgi:hypothetical protein